MQAGRVQSSRLTKVGEPVRERETLKYYPYLSRAGQLNTSGQSPASAELTTCEDPILTALAQTGAFQTGTDRSLVSLFDTDYQYIVAEASPSSRLVPSLKSSDCKDPIWLCGTAIPRSHGVCELSLLGEDALQTTAAGSTVPLNELPLTIAQDLVTDLRFCSKPYCQPGTLCRFYAAVPIRTSRGVNIGVYCVINETPGKEWSDGNTQTLRDISQTIMEHLESKRLAALQRRNERMNRGLGSLIEGKATLSGLQEVPHEVPHTSTTAEAPATEGLLDGPQPYLQRAKKQVGSTRPTEQPTRDSPVFRPSSSLDSSTDDTTAQTIASKAATILRESTGVEGCVFVDATMEAYRHPRAEASKAMMEKFSLMTSSDENAEDSYMEQDGPSCGVLGYSTSTRCNLSADKTNPFASAFTGSFLAKLIQKYPNGKIFDFVADQLLDYTVMPEKEEESSVPHNADLPLHRMSADEMSLSRQSEASVLLNAFPGASSIAFTPIWDPRKGRWYAGGFIYTNDAHRRLSVGADLSHLRVFGTLTMAEILRSDDLIADKAKSDLLGALSHELRSPLHGIMMSSELLSDTELSVFQGHVAHTIEICSRTLLDTIDHLLDYAKINNIGKNHLKSETDLQQDYPATEHDVSASTSLCSVLQLDSLFEEVVESVFAGHTFQQPSIASGLGQESLSPDKSDNSLVDPDTVHTLAHSGSTGTHATRLGIEERDVIVLIDIDASYDWSYFIEVGAIRRIILNLFGNALKYTRQGRIRVSLVPETSSMDGQTPEKAVKFVFEDTGKGIGADYLQNDLFKPFSQEDTLTPGNGLGLSLVRKIVSQLQGDISIQSQIGMGTTVSVTLPLQQMAPQSPETYMSFSDDDRTFQDQVRDLRGLRVSVSFTEDNTIGDTSNWQQSVESICRDWLHMETITPSESSTSPDILLWLHDTRPPSTHYATAEAPKPSVVVCTNALNAYHQFKSIEGRDRSAIYEFISQPVGPRKLARALLLAYTRWMNLSEAPLPTSFLNKQPKASGAAMHSFEYPHNGKTEVSRSVLRQHSTEWNDAETDDTSVLSDSKVSTAVGSASTSDEALDKSRLNKILLVDDNHINLKVLSVYMKKLGFEFDTASDGKEAAGLFCVPQCPYSCVLMDISMPVMNGFESTRCMRAHERLRNLAHIPIIALSGLASEDAHNEAKGSGMDFFLTKPVKLKTLASFLESRGISAHQ